MENIINWEEIQDALSDSYYRIKQKREILEDLIKKNHEELKESENIPITNMFYHVNKTAIHNLKENMIVEGANITLFFLLIFDFNRRLKKLEKKTDLTKKQNNPKNPRKIVKRVKKTEKK